MTGGTRQLARGLQIQARSVKALVIRDMMLRYGRNNIGFLWVVVEPMILTAGVLLMFSIIKSQYEHGTHVLSMVLTGYMPLTLWRHTSNPGVALLQRSSGVLYHRNITVLDVFLARMILEGIGTTAALTLVYSLLWVAGIVAPIAKPSHVIAAWALLWWLGSSVALIIAALSEGSEVAERFVQPFQYLTVPLSGIFFMIDWLPERAQRIIAYNPIANCIEFFRDGFFGDTVQTFYDPGYIILVTLFLFLLGLVLLDWAKTRRSSP
jgi:capsular polysaccharide transport system permease protein